MAETLREIARANLVVDPRTQNADEWLSRAVTHYRRGKYRRAEAAAQIASSLYLRDLCLLQARQPDPMTTGEDPA